MNRGEGESNNLGRQNYSLLEQPVDIFMKKLMKISIIDIDIKCFGNERQNMCVSPNNNLIYEMRKMLDIAFHCNKMTNRKINSPVTIQSPP